MESEANAFHVEFPDFSCSILQKLNQQRQRGQLCDITVSIGGHQFRAHRAVLAASSPYFCDQVLLKNSARVVLPEVMQPCVFERLLLSCYTGALSLPSAEVVAFLTAASFLQMWHVVDKCTELLEGGTPCHKARSSGGSGSGGGVVGGSHLERAPSPEDGSYLGDGGEGSGAESLGASDGFGQTGSHREVAEMEVLLDGGDVSPPALEFGGPQSNGSSPLAERDASPNEVRDGNSTECRYSRPAYVQPSIMGHRRWMQVKTERPSREDCAGLFAGAGDPEQLSLAPSGLEDGLDGKLEGSLDGDRSYEDPLDFYGTSAEGSSQGKAESFPIVPKDDPLGVGALGEADGEDGPELGGGLQEEASSQSGFAPAGFKLYPCQCGKKFAHKSQRDRHMSMHLGLRPYGCAVCGKSFKMKHHLVGHMKIHTGNKPYECGTCSKRFMWRDSFNRHMSSCARGRQTRHAAPDPAAQTC